MLGLFRLSLVVANGGWGGYPQVVVCRLLTASLVV